MRAVEFITKKKRHKRRPHRAAYGPGPFGGYGYFTGYSGHSGGDSGVGEASYKGNIGAMELAKFFRIADDQQKKLLKELIAKKKKGLAWKLIQDVVDVKLQGLEFNGMYEDSYTAERPYTTEKQILTRIRQIMHDRKLSGTESNAGELLRLKQQLKDLRSQQGVSEQDFWTKYGVSIAPGKKPEPQQKSPKPNWRINRDGTATDMNSGITYYRDGSVKKDVEEGKVKLYTDPDYFGAEVDDSGFDSLPVINIPANQLVGFEPDDKMNQPKSKANVKKIVAGLKKGDKLPPILVRKYKKGYQVLDGHHRFWAYKLLKIKSIPAQIVPAKDIEEISKQGVAEGVPQPGPSSGAPKQFGPNAEIQTRQMTAKQLIDSVPGLPYYNNVVDDWDAKDYSWGVTKKVIEYATYLKDHPESLAKLPPILVLNGKFEDGAHRVSAIWLLQQRMDPKNPLWKNAKLNVQFVKQGVAEGWREAESLKLDLNSGWVGAENSIDGVLIYAEDIQLNDSKIWISFIHNLTLNKTLETKISDDYNGRVDIDDSDIELLIADIVNDIKKYYGSTWEEISDELHGGFEIEEGWRDTLAGLALGAGVAMSGSADARTNVEKVVVSPGQTVYSIARAFGTTPEVIQKLNKLDKNFTIKPDQVIKVPKLDTVDISSKEKKSAEEKTSTEKKSQKKLDISKTLTGTTHEAVLTKAAKAAGITDPIELAAFLAQCAHESHDFKSMVEYGGSLDFRKYDPKHAPKKAKELGNKKTGDGARYKGRGYIQLTGRYNYKRAGEALGLPLEKSPELAEKPEVAAKIAVWFWQSRVQPRVDNFNDVRAVTKPINPGLNGLEDRQEAFVDFKKFKMAQR